MRITETEKEMLKAQANVTLMYKTSNRAYFGKTKQIRKRAMNKLVKLGYMLNKTNPAYDGPSYMVKRVHIFGKQAL